MCVRDDGRACGCVRASGQTVVRVDACTCARLVCGVNYVVSFLGSVLVLSRPMSFLFCVVFGICVVCVSTLSALGE